MIFQNCTFIFVTDAQTDGWTDGQTKCNMPLQHFQSLGIKMEVGI